MKNYIDSYNQVVSDDTTDCKKFFNILDSDFEKFRYFHQLINEVDDELKCVEEYKALKMQDRHLGFIIKNNNPEATQEALENKINSYSGMYEDYFNTSVKKQGNDIIMDISLSENYKTERKIYPDIYKKL